MANYKKVLEDEKDQTMTHLQRIEAGEKAALDFRNRASIDQRLRAEYDKLKRQEKEDQVKILEKR